MTRTSVQQFEENFDDLSQSSKDLVIKKLGSFAFYQFEKAGLLNIAAKVLSKAELNFDDVLFLANEVEIPFLGKLVEASSYKSNSGFRLRPVTYLPLAGMVRRLGRPEARVQASEQLKAIDKDLSLDSSIYIVLDEWSAMSRIDEFLDDVDYFTQQRELKNSYKLLGPSTLDISGIISDQGSEEDFQRLVDVLNKHGVHSIEGGGDLNIHRRAVKNKLEVAIAQEVFVEEQKTGQGHSAKFSRPFVEQLLDIRELSRSSLVLNWFAQFASSPKEESKPLGGQLIRAVAVARLVLPEVKYIRAPLTSFGEKLAHAATEFGANDLGFAAVDSDSAKALGISLLSKVKKTVEQHCSGKISY